MEDVCVIKRACLFRPQLPLTEYHFGQTPSLLNLVVFERSLKRVILVCPRENIYLLTNTASFQADHALELCCPSCTVWPGLMTMGLQAILFKVAYALDSASQISPLHKLESYRIYGQTLAVFCSFLKWQAFTVGAYSCPYKAYFHTGVPQSSHSWLTPMDALETARWAYLCMLMMPPLGAMG